MRGFSFLPQQNMKIPQVNRNVSAPAQLLECHPISYYQIEKGNPERAIAFLESAQESLRAAILDANQQS